MGGGRSFELPYPQGGGGSRERGSRDRTFIKWQCEDQSWLRNRAARRLNEDFF